MDNKFILCWVGKLKTQHQVEKRPAKGPRVDRPFRKAVRRQVEAAVSQCREPSGSTSPDAANQKFPVRTFQGKGKARGGCKNRNEKERSAAGDRVHVLTGVSWERNPNRVEALLSRHAATLQELQVSSLCSIGASDVSRLPKLRKLSLWLSADCRAVPERWLGRLQSLEVRGGSREALPDLLRAHRDSLQEVHLDVLGLAELLELQRMPALRSLSFGGDLLNCVLPDLWQGSLQRLHVKFSLRFGPQETVVGVLRAHRESLLDVKLDVASREELLEVQQMPALRQLRLTQAFGSLQDNPALPKVWLARLRKLSVSSLLPRETVRSVVRAQRGSLRHLAVVTFPGSEWLESLPALLGRCGLKRLRTLELKRKGCSHSYYCTDQLTALRAALPGCAVECRDM